MATVVIYYPNGTPNQYTEVQIIRSTDHGVIFHTKNQSFSTFHLPIIVVKEIEDGPPVRRGWFRRLLGLP